MLRLTFGGSVDMPVKDGDDPREVAAAFELLVTRYLRSKGGDPAVNVHRVAIAAPRAES